MKPATVKQIKDELKELPEEQLLNLCLRLAKFKKENKELLTYLIFEAHHEPGYIALVKEDIDDLFEQINYSRMYFIKKGVRKALKSTLKHIRFSQNKETEVELLLYFCTKVKGLPLRVKQNRVISNLFGRYLITIQKKLLALHEDLQHDYGKQLEELKS